ncbi:ribonuclease HII [Candidatus Dependentiae bacterium]|nr:ribonuclease HII [Candidatus Dependentiae bacterium]
MHKIKNYFKQNYFEKTAWNNNKYVCGIDEVGRGCLAGPIVTCACILPKNLNFAQIKDSKVLTKEQREKAFFWIKKNCFFSISIYDHKKIDKINIYQATKVSMQKSLLQLLNIIPFDKNKIEFVLTDAMPIKLPKNFNSNFFYFTKGEKYSQSIAAASIAAKVFRDNLLSNLEKIFPKFKFSENKGYGTNKHIKIINQIDTSIIHRKTFCKNILTPQNIIKTKQTSLF